MDKNIYVAGYIATGIVPCVAHLYFLFAIQQSSEENNNLIDEIVQSLVRVIGGAKHRRGVLIFLMFFR
jgi:hypothetical protein